MNPLRAGIEGVEYARKYEQSKKRGVKIERIFLIAEQPLKDGRFEKYEAQADRIGAVQTI